MMSRDVKISQLRMQFIELVSTLTFDEQRQVVRLLLTDWVDVAELTNNETITMRVLQALPP